MWHQRFGHSREEMTPSKYAGTALIIVADGLIARGLFVDKKQFDKEFRDQLRNEVAAGLVTGDSLHLALTDPTRQWMAGEDPTREWAAIATAYAIEAIMAEHDGHQVLAWTYAVDAMFAANASRSNAIGDAVLQDARAASSSNAGKVSGLNRSEAAADRHTRWEAYAKSMLNNGTAKINLTSKAARHFNVSETQMRNVLQDKGLLNGRKKRK
ncbi:hypothetical protein [Rhodanobacter sp. DHB23]|uniref:hypothetical protein n=1 Tax=Rhodanobacter sp. DHB23 TaxID=2775923 RepID=UPI00177F41E2|nr:hypothetical protein [Rhodanobacter sp. DHB23]MBD8873848.1 hypothetical protein [Rhodanobacter sp. DHB23]